MVQFLKSNKAWRFLWTFPVAGLILAFLWAAGCSPYRGKKERAEAAENDWLQLKEYAPVPADPLSMAEAVRWAHQYNLEQALRQREEAINAELASGATLAMLPELTATGTDSYRNEERAASSVSVETRRQSLEPSTSTERHTRTANIQLAWNLLDFGLSYVRARQARDRARMASQRLRRTRQNLTLEVVQAYWRIVVAENARHRAASILARAREYRQKLRKQIETKTIAAEEGLRHEKRLLEMEVKLDTFARQIAVAKAELAGLLGLRPGTDFAVVHPELAAPPALSLDDVDAFEREAILQRPELFEQDLKVRVTADEARAAILRMLPGINFFVGSEYDSNRFLVKNQWTNVGVTATAQLLRWPRQWRERRAARKRIDLVKQERLALMIGVLTQVRLAVIDCHDARRRLELFRSLDSVQRRILEAMRKQQREGQIHEGAILQAEAEHLFGRVRYLTAYGDLQVAVARLHNSLGRDLYGTAPEEQADRAAIKANVETMIDLPVDDAKAADSKDEPEATPQEAAPAAPQDAPSEDPAPATEEAVEPEPEQAAAPAPSVPSLLSESTTFARGGLRWRRSSAPAKNVAPAPAVAPVVLDETDRPKALLFTMPETD